VPPKSRLGQNFLRDQQAIQRIAAALGDCRDRTVVEIGPGKGAITQELVGKVGKLIAVEVDRKLATGLSSAFSNSPGYEKAFDLRVENVDVLEFDFEAAAAQAGEKLILLGNLPYYITSPILLKLAESCAVLDRAVLMVQREVADRVTAQPGSREYGLLSVTVQAHGPVEALFSLPPGAFSPPPEVHSTVFRWRFAPRFEEIKVDRASFLAFLRQIFALKRKTLGNNLRAAGYSADLIPDLLAVAGIDARARAEALPIESFARLWRSLQTEGAIPKGWNGSE
jgi:16S rRNA (adenine1518-N6/adenine1519-N6)-dimethyltransferase